MKSYMRGLASPYERITNLGGLCVAEGDIERLGRRFECKVRRFLEAVPLPAKGLGRRRIAHANAVRVQSAFDVHRCIHYTHGVAVLRIAKMPHSFPRLPEPCDLAVTVREAGEQPATATPDPELRAAAEHLLQQTLSYLKEQGKRVIPLSPLEPGVRVDVQIDALNFFDAAAERVTLITHVLIELAHSQELVETR